MNPTAPSDSFGSGRLRRRPAIKICGLTLPEDVEICLYLGVDFTGFIFAEKSPRRISAQAAAQLPSGRAVRVGVFAGQPLDRVQAIMREARLDYAQLHGGESPDYCRALGPERVIKVLWPERAAQGNAPDGNGITAALDRECALFADACSWFLLESGTQGGGSGRQLDRALLTGFTPAKPWFLAGGIGPGNIAHIPGQCRPNGLDCNSAVETRPGVKDHEKLHALMRARDASPFAQQG